MNVDHRNSVSTESRINCKFNVTQIKAIQMNIFNDLEQLFVTILQKKKVKLELNSQFMLNCLFKHIFQMKNILSRNVFIFIDSDKIGSYKKTQNYHISCNSVNDTKCREFFISCCAAFFLLLWAMLNLLVRLITLFRNFLLDNHFSWTFVQSLVMIVHRTQCGFLAVQLVN